MLLHIQRRGNAMILGMSVSAFTILHVVISLVGVAAGLVALVGMFSSNRLGRWTALFLAATVLTSVTGFLFPISSFTPALAVGALSLMVLAAALLGLYVFHLGGTWRAIYVAGAVVALYFNVFVLVVQAFQKLPFLQPLAPTQSEPPFVVTQVAVLVIFAVLGLFAVKRFHPAAMAR
jgi:hypothetical protein